LPHGRHAIQGRRVDDVEARISVIGIDHDFYRIADIADSVLRGLGIGISVSDGIGVRDPIQPTLIDDEIRITVIAEKGSKCRHPLPDGPHELYAALRREVGGQHDARVKFIERKQRLLPKAIQLKTPPWPV